MNTLTDSTMYHNLEKKYCLTNTRALSEREKKGRRELYAARTKLGVVMKKKGHSF